MGPRSGPTSLQAQFCPPPGGLARREVEAIKELRVGLDPHANENANKHLGRGGGMGAGCGEPKRK